MKTYLRILSLLLIISSFDAIDAQGFRVGVKGGINLAKHTEEFEHTEFNYRIGSIGGAFISYDFNDLISLQSEVLYSMKGNTRVFQGQLLAQGSISESRVITKLNYIEIPLLLFISFELNSNIRPKILFGPIISFLQTATAEAEYGGSSYEINTKELWKSNDFGIILGSGLDYKVGENKIVLDIRYNLGLADLDNGIGGGKITSNALSFLLGYSIVL